MFIRDTRDPFDARYKSDTPERPNPYYEGFLNEEDKDEIDGYDYLADNVVDSFFFNMDIHDRIMDAFKDAGLDLDKVDHSVLISRRDASDEITQKEWDKLNPETKLVLSIKEGLEYYIERDRDELITSMIDNMDEQDYEENFKKVWGKGQEELTQKEIDDAKADMENFFFHKEGGEHDV